VPPAGTLASCWRLENRRRFLLSGCVYCQASWTSGPPSEGDELDAHLLGNSHQLVRADLMGLKRADLIDGVEEPAGATSALAEPQGAITLFI
jgi:hypothetical protein